ncbi:helix-turn-helix domain-containing protein [Streptococcus sp. NLN64]|uniref:helix-turn-helix domain-containing protein n=1 Tax=Streptococcus sp. NLN64 TaxID=2822799 RepID=UPI0018C8EEFF|nr:helix-turn-helix domain-containing protein [Streptococcus sp. NLN64]MBG9367990.1 helix-turn-helix domain-containing protein [Streptococcus sp. NLN64]
MRKVTIGEVLRLERIHQGKKLSQIQKATDIQLEYLEALEKNDFDQMPSPFYARSFIKKYAWELGLDDKILLAAYENGSMVAYDEIEVDEDKGRTTRIERRKIKSYLPVFYFVLISLGILGSVGYFVWNYSTNHVSETPITSSSSSSSQSEEGTNQSEEQDENLTISMSTYDGITYVTASGVNKPIDLKLSRLRNGSSWITVSETEVANGVTLNNANPSFEAELVTNYEFYIGLGDPTAVEMTLNGQKVPLDDLPAEPITLVLRTSSQMTSSSENSGNTVEQETNVTEASLENDSLE